MTMSMVLADSVPVDTSDPFDLDIRVMAVDGPPTAGQDVVADQTITPYSALRDCITREPTFCYCIPSLGGC
jgi:hypothetical protein